MNTTVNELLDNINDDLPLDTLNVIVKKALAAIYSKLRNDLGFDSYSKCFVTSIGSEEYDVEMCITDGSSYNPGENYINTYWI